MRETLSIYLRKYYDIQKNILLCYRPNKDSSWRDRCFYLDEKYDAIKPYNHRGMLNNEVVIEFDDVDSELNRKCADEVCKRLSSDGLSFSKWFSGGKSVHVHILIDYGDASNVKLLKTVFIRHYTDKLPLLPDLQLTYDNHLIRAEFGLHESTGKSKSLIYKSKDYPKLNIINKEVWNKYVKAKSIVLQRRVSIDIKGFEELPKVKSLFKTEELKRIGDGRERALLLLIRILRNKYTKEELIKYCIDWYKYAGGNKLNERQIAGKVYYYWEKDYSIRFWNEYLDDLLADIGLKYEQEEEQKNG